MSVFGNTSSRALVITSSITSSISTEENLPYLFKLINNRKWRKIKRRLRSKKGPIIIKDRDSTNLTALAYAMGHNAPLDIIQEITRVDPTLLAVCDDYNATALHVGCLNGASPECVNFILNSHTPLARVLDADRRCPLHHAVEFLCTTGEDAGVGCFLSGIESLKLICYAVPEMVYVQDIEGGTPIDLLQITKVDKDVDSEEYERLDNVYQILKETSILVYKEQKQLSENKRINEEHAKSSESKLKSTRHISTASLSSSIASCTISVDTPKSAFSRMNCSVMNEKDHNHNQNHIHERSKSPLKSKRKKKILKR